MLSNFTLYFMSSSDVTEIPCLHSFYSANHCLLEAFQLIMTRSKGIEKQLLKDEQQQGLLPARKLKLMLLYSIIYPITELSNCIRESADYHNQGCDNSRMAVMFILYDDCDRGA